MRIACVQCHIAFNDPEKNSAFAVATLESLHSQGVDLVVFPEAFLTGYCFDSEQQAQEIALRISKSDGHFVLPPHAADIQEACNRLNMMSIFGLAAIEGQTLVNAALFLRPCTDPAIYRKTHLPELGFDKFVKPGDSLPVFETDHGRIGILICFDLRPPEAARVLALTGADLIVLPTNWPEGAEMAAEAMSIVRAVENRVFLATCNRIGFENGFSFIGRSKIIAPNGKVLASAEDDAETIVADIDLHAAREKRVVVVPGQYETTVFESRRADLYGPIMRQRAEAAID